MSAKPKKYTLAEAKVEMDRLACERSGHRPGALFDIFVLGGKAPRPEGEYSCRCGAYTWSARRSA